MRREGGRNRKVCRLNSCGRPEVQSGRPATGVLNRKSLEVPCEVLPRCAVGNRGALESAPEGTPEIGRASGSAPEGALPVGLKGRAPSRALPGARPISHSTPRKHFPEHPDFPQHISEALSSFQGTSRDFPFSTPAAAAGRPACKSRVSECYAPELLTGCYRPIPQWTSIRFS